MLLSNGKEPYLEVLGLAQYKLVTIPGHGWEWTKDLLCDLANNKAMKAMGYPWLRIKESSPLGTTLFLCSWPSLFGPPSPQRDILRKCLIAVLPDVAEEFTD